MQALSNGTANGVNRNAGVEDGHERIRSVSYIDLPQATPASISESTSANTSSPDIAAFSSAATESQLQNDGVIGSAACA
jgi:hypothetical protein